MQRVHFIVVMVFVLTGCVSLKPKPVGLLDGQLQSCPPAPKCVASVNQHRRNRIEPLSYQGSKQTSYQKIIRIINSLERSRIVIQKADYIHAEIEVTSVNWIDDLEFHFDDVQKIIHWSSSASADIGYWDWGENRRRAQHIREMYDEDTSE